MPVRVDVIERQSGRAVGLELGGDFVGHLGPRRKVRRDLQAVAAEIVPQPAGAIEKPRDLRARAHGIAVDQHDMQPDPKARHGARPRHRVSRRRGADHETRGGENAAAVCCFDCGVDGLAQPKIVRGNDQAVQCAGSRRWRRKPLQKTPRCRPAGSAHSDSGFRFMTRAGPGLRPGIRPPSHGNRRLASAPSPRRSSSHTPQMR